ncbi:MAG: phosphoglycerate dehydrogenase [Atopobiaceae bacterium]|nr:phosphoglycerate dehydrogenase [Atopobiaceae bacterium]
MFKVHCMNVIAKVGTDQLGDNYELVDSLDDANAIMVRSAKLHDTVFPESLLAIGRAGAGVNNIPLDRCADEGIVVFNTPGANANSVKEAVIAALLMASRDYVGGVEWVRENSDDPDIGKSAEKAKKQFAGNEIAGKTIGVVGLGAIGALVANAARSLGMKVLGYDPYLSIKAAWSLDRHVKHVTNLDDVLTGSDFVTIHVPAMPSTKGMIGRDQIAKMRDGVIFLNFSRDSLVDEQAMAEALEDGHVACYVTDFANSVSANMKNSIVFPHLGASTDEAEDRCAIMAAKELKDYLENGNIVNSVNFGEVDLGPIMADARVAVFHKNVPNMIGNITSILSDAGVNIENMTNKSKGEHAYTLIEVTGSVSQEAADRIAAIEDVIRVRVIEAAK